MRLELAIFGLGNPGPKYAGTRHNIGYSVIDLLAERYRAAPPRSAHRALLQPVRMGAVCVALVKPLTYMNRSGDSARGIAHGYGLSLDRMWVVVDDFNLPLGTLRIRKRGSDGGHNGLASIIDCLGSADFPRFRLGIGQPARGVSVIDYVLGPFPEADREPVARLVEAAADAVELAVRQGLTTAMNRFNGSVLAEDAPGL